MEQQPEYQPESETEAEASSALTNATTAATGHVGELPLFPLDVVLFPFMPLPLHIFEERYKEMINRCVQESLPFGIVLATGVDDITGGVQTCDIGCMARIARVEKLKDGRMNIEVIGEGRFRILDTHEQLPYRVGLTEPFDDHPCDDTVVNPLADDVKKLLREFLTRSLAATGQKPPPFELPDDPEQLSFMAGWALPLDNEEKQTLLADPNTAERLTAARDLLRREVTRLRRAAESQQTFWKPVAPDAFAAYRCAN